jgi:hypothetical protein
VRRIEVDAHNRVVALASRNDALVALLRANRIKIDASLTGDIEGTPTKYGRSPTGASSYNTPLSVAHSEHKLQLEARVAAMVEMRKSSEKKLKQKRQLMMGKE